MHKVFARSLLNEAFCCYCLANSAQQDQTVRIGISSESTLEVNAVKRVSCQHGLTMSMSYIKPLNAAFLKWTCQAMHLEEFIVNFRNINMNILS